MQSRVKGVPFQVAMVSLALSGRKLIDLAEALPDANDSKEVRKLERRVRRIANELEKIGDKYV